MKVDFSFDELVEAFTELYNTAPVTDGFEDWGIQARNDSARNLWESFEPSVQAEVAAYILEYLKPEPTPQLPPQR